MTSLSYFTLISNLWITCHLILKTQRESPIFLSFVLIIKHKSFSQNAFLLAISLLCYEVQCSGPQNKCLGPVVLWNRGIWEKVLTNSATPTPALQRALRSAGECSNYSHKCTFSLTGRRMYFKHRIHNMHRESDLEQSRTRSSPATTARGIPKAIWV